MIEIKHKAKLHNRFDIVVKDTQTGEEQHYEAENIILDRMYSEILCSNSTGRQVGARLAFGGGTGTLGPEITELFDEIGRKTTTIEEIDLFAQTPFCVKTIVLTPAEYVGETFTEIGLAYTTTGIETHAMIEDSEGNPISIGPKTNTQEITFYATIYAEIDSNSDVDFPIRHSTSIDFNNRIVCLMLGAGNTDKEGLTTTNQISGSESKAVTHKGVDYYELSGDSLERVLGAQFNVVDAPERTMKTQVLRFESEHSNGKIWSLVHETRGSTNPRRGGTARLVFPKAGIYTGYSFTGKAIGTGDGATTGFDLPWDDHVWNSETIYVDGVAQTRGTDYEIYKLASGTQADYKYFIDTELDHPGTWETFRRMSTTDQFNINFESLPYEIIMDFGELSKWGIDGVRYMASTNENTHAVQEFQVEYSSDKNTWENAGTFNTSGTQVYEFQKITTEFRYLKLKVLQTANSDYFRYRGFYARVPDKQIIFTNPPAENAPITGDWDVHYIPKDEGHMLDVQFTLQFGEGVT